MGKRKRDEKTAQNPEPQPFHAGAFLQNCAQEEEIRRVALADAKHSYDIFHSNRGFVSFRRRMTVDAHNIENSSRRRLHTIALQRRLLEAKGFTFDPDSNDDRLTPLEYLVCDSVFFGSRAHRNCHAMRRLLWRNHTDVDFPKTSLQITKTDPEKDYTAAELQYMLPRYFPHPDFDLANARWTNALSREVKAEVRDTLENVCGVSGNISPAEALKYISAFDWEAIGKSVHRCGFAVYQHYKHILMQTNTPMSLREQEALLHYARKAGFAPDGTLRSKSAKSTFHEVWSAIAAKMGSRTPWECFATFRSYLVRLSLVGILSKNKTFPLCKNQYFRTGNKLVPFLPFEDKIILEAYAKGAIDETALAAAMQSVPRVSRQVENRVTQLTGLSHAHRSIRTHSQREETKMQILQYVYGKDAVGMAPLHFGTDTAAAAILTENAKKVKRAPKANVKEDIDTEDIFQPIPKPVPVGAIALDLPREFMVDSVQFPLEVLPFESERDDQIDARQTTSAASLTPSCFSVDGVFIPALPANTVGTAQACLRLLRHFKDCSIPDEEDLPKDALRGSAAVATRNALVALFGHHLAAKQSQ